MPTKASIIYIREKYIHEMMIEQYITEMLWAQVSVNYKNVKKYKELNKPKDKTKKKTGKQIMDELIAHGKKKPVT